MLTAYQSKAEERLGLTVRPDDSPHREISEESPRVGRRCRSCHGEGRIEQCFGPSDRSCAMARCPDCEGTGRAPHLSHSDLAALAAD